MNRVWFYKPHPLYWHGWRTLLPFHRGHDEYGRWVAVIGFTATGQICIAVCNCHGELLCVQDQEKLARIKRIKKAGKA